MKQALRAPRPKRFLEAISDLGGIKLFDSEARGDVLAILGTDKAVPVRGRMKRQLINNVSGRPLDGNDGLIQALWEMGYFGAKPAGMGFVQSPDAGGGRGGNAPARGDDVDPFSFFQEARDPGPRSLRGVTQMTDDEVVTWFNANVEVRRPNDAAAALWFKTDDTLARPNVRVAIDWGGHAITTFRGRTSGERSTGPNSADVKKGAQMFVRLAAVIRAWLIIEKSERIYFSGATDAHDRMYRTMLRVINFPGYVSREEIRRAASASKATENVTPIRTAQSTQNTSVFFFDSAKRHCRKTAAGWRGAGRRLGKHWLFLGGLYLRKHRDC